MPQFWTGTGKFAQDQHATFIDLRCAEFLRHQIHSIFQRSDECDIGRAIVAQQILPPQTAIAVSVNRNPSRLRKPAIDLADQKLDLLPQILVLRNVRAAGHNNLHQRHLPPQLRIFLQQHAE